MGIDIARSHHERWNGKGYPNGLAGESIPLSARIMAVGGVYDALRSRRVYKPASRTRKPAKLSRRKAASSSIRFWLKSLRHSKTSSLSSGPDFQD